MHTFIKRVTAPVILALSLLAAMALPGFAHAGGETISAGEFTGINNHTVVGAVSIVKTDSGYEIVMGEDFVFDGAPDPKVALGKDGKYDPSTLIQLLKSDTGAQSYVVPDSIDVSLFNEVHIWCEKFNVGLAVAPLQ